MIYLFFLYFWYNFRENFIMLNIKIVLKYLKIIIVIGCFDIFYNVLECFVLFVVGRFWSEWSRAII